MLLVDEFLLFIIVLPIPAVHYWISLFPSIVSSFIKDVTSFRVTEVNWLYLIILFKMDFVSWFWLGFLFHYFPGRKHCYSICHYFLEIIIWKETLEFGAVLWLSWEDIHIKEDNNDETSSNLCFCCYYC